MTRIKAEEYLEAWKKLKVQAGINETYDNEESNSEVIRNLKDKLFVQYGEDVDDIFEAFKYYGLETTVTEAERQSFSIQWGE